MTLSVAASLWIACGTDADPAGQLSAPVLTGPEPAPILVSTSAAVRERCAAELAATYCSPADQRAAASACRRRLPLSLGLGCAGSACLFEYTATRDRCIAGPTYPTAGACTLPVEDDCTFYRGCLERSQPCGPSGYPLGFGERLCSTFIVRRGEFSVAGQAWLRGVRSCLQRALVPLLRGPSRTCDQLGDTAYASHAACYTAPENSICALPTADVLSLARVLSLDLLDPRAIRQMRDVAATCLSRVAASDTAPSASARRAFFTALAEAAGDATSLQRFVDAAQGERRR